MVSAHAPALTLAGDDSLLVESPGARGDGVVRGALVAEYSRRPLVLLNDAQARYSVVVEQWWLHPSISLAWAHRFFVGLELPVLLSESGDEPPPDTEALPDAGGVALGDPRLVARARLLGRPDALHAGLGAELFLPLGGGAYAGDGSFRLGRSLRSACESRASFSTPTRAFCFAMAELCRVFCRRGWARR